MGLFAVLIILFAVNIFNLNKIGSFLSGDPVEMTITVINPTLQQCDDCFDTSSVLGFLTNSKEIKITDKKVVTPESSEYENLIKKYGIKNLPAVIVSGDIENRKTIEIIKSLPGKDIKDSIVLQDLLPYYDIKTNTKKGFLDVVILEDKSCKDCFDNTQYTTTLERFRMKIATSSVYDISSAKGKFYVKKYNIKKIPTMLILKSANDYPGFKNLWKQVGTIESDGVFVFREVQKVSSKFKNI